MANTTMFRGFTADFKPMFCRGDWPEYGPPFSAPHYHATPPYDSHACGAYNQGYFTLGFPLVPNLQDNDAHKWMREALANVKAVGDILRLIAVPLRHYVTFQHIEVVCGDEICNGLYLKPVAERASWDIAKSEWVWEVNADYTAAVTASGVGQLPCGKIQASDEQYAFINLLPAAGKKPCTFGHNMVKYDTNGVPTEGLDEYYGAVVLGLQVAEGSATAIENLKLSNTAIYMSIKLEAFECQTQIG